MHSSHMLREGARPEVVRDNMGHANIDVTQNVYDKSWWEERVDAVTQAVEAVTNAAQNAEKEEKKNQPESVSNYKVIQLRRETGSVKQDEADFWGSCGALRRLVRFSQLYAEQPNFRLARDLEQSGRASRTCRCGSPKGSLDERLPLRAKSLVRPALQS